MNEANGQQAGPAKGKGRGRGRAQAKATTAKPAAKKPAVARRGRQKMYAVGKVQAAAERQRELKAAYSAVANALRPALIDLADRTVDKLKSALDAHEEVDAYKQIMQFLDKRLSDTRAHIDARYKANMAELAVTHDILIRCAEEEIISRLDDEVEKFYDAQLARLNRLEFLHRNRLPVDLLDDAYEYHSVSDERADEITGGAYVSYTMINGHKVEVPCAKYVPWPESDILAHEFQMKYAKRKADGEPDDQPPAKRAASALNGPRRVAPVRHIGGLLSAPSPEEDDGVPTPAADSKQATPLLDEGDAPSGSPAAEPGPVDNEKLPAIPNGASEPDAYNARLVNKRKVGNTDPNNRIMVPALFQFEPYEIGFRDSTNTKAKSTKAKRGKFWLTPNSNTMHFDRVILAYDATQNEEGEEGGLDEELVKKHGLHPKYGLFLESSVNNAEPPKPLVMDSRSVVLVTPSGRKIYASRTHKRGMKDEGMEFNRLMKTKAMSNSLSQFTRQEGIPEEETRPTREQRLECHRAALRGLTRSDAIDVDDDEFDDVDDYTAAPAASTAPLGDDTEEEEAAVVKKEVVEEKDEQRLEPTEGLTGGMPSLAALLDAASSLDAAEATVPPTPAAVAYSTPASGTPAASTPAAGTPASGTPARQRTSRPFDPVRDVFREASPKERAPIRAPGSGDAAASNLSMLAELAIAPEETHLRHGDVILNTETQEPMYPVPPAEIQYHNVYQPQQHQQHPQQGETYPLQMAEVGSHIPQDLLDPRLFGEAPPPQQSRNFMYTALNPASSRGPPLAPDLIPAPTVPAPIPGPMPPYPPPGAPLPPQGHYQGQFPGSTVAGPHEAMYGPPIPMGMPNPGMYYQQPMQNLTFHHHFNPHAEPPPPPPPPPPAQSHPVATRPPPPPPPPPVPMSLQSQPATMAPQTMPQMTLGPARRRTSPRPRQRTRTNFSPAASSQQQQHQQAQQQAQQQQQVQQQQQQPPPQQPQQQPPPSGGSAPASKYRKLEPAPIPPHRIAWDGKAKELKTVPYDYEKGIKDYTPSEPPPSHGPRTIRGWAYNNIKRTAVHLEPLPREPRDETK